MVTDRMCRYRASGSEFRGGDYAAPSQRPDLKHFASDAARWLLICVGRPTVAYPHSTEEATTWSSRADRSGENAELLIQGTIEVELGRSEPDLGDAIAVTDRCAGVSRDTPPDLVDHRVGHRSGPQVLEVQE